MDVLGGERGKRRDRERLEEEGKSFGFFFAGKDRRERRKRRGGTKRIE